MPRLYRITTEGVAVSAAQDLLQINGATGKGLALISWKIASTNATPTAQLCQTRLRLLPATVTYGSGGGTPSIKPVDPGDVAATFTAVSNSTTKATTSGTALILDQDSFYDYNGLLTTPNIPFFQSGAGACWVLELLSVPSGALNLSVVAEVSETG